MIGLPEFSQFRRIVVKVGSSLLVDPRTGLKTEWLAALGEDLAALHKSDKDILVVSSGAIALGRGVLGLKSGPLKLEESQAAAAVGQIALSRAWAEVLGHHAITTGQILVTLGDTEERHRYLNARATLGRLLDLKAIPVVNENDTVATTEIRYGDNDRLAARVATMAGADLLVLLSDIDGLYTAPPHQDPNATLIPVIPRITAEIEAMAGGAASELSRGGMRTKIEAAKIATVGGTHMVIADGRVTHPLNSIRTGKPCSWFLATTTTVSARKTWIGGGLEPKGILHLDKGAADAIRAGKSLLAAGVVRVDGEFESGDTVVMRAPDGRELGRGLIAYDSTEAALLAGRSSRDIATLLGYDGRPEVIHRDDMALGSA
jgi:glutamate 5-kinase